jgi:hypothetical protein
MAVEVPLVEVVTHHQQTQHKEVMVETLQILHLH